MVSGHGDTSQHGLDFDGTNDYVNATDSATLSVTGNLTLEAWAYPSIGSIMFLIAKDGVDNTRSYYLAVLATGKVRCLVSSDGAAIAYFTTTATLSSDVWRHLACVYDATSQTLSVYIHGINQTGTLTNAVPAAIFDSAIDFRIGDAVRQHLYFNGTKDEVRVSNITRYTGNFVAPSSEFTDDADTMALWHMNEGTGQTASDDSGNGNDGTLGSTGGSDANDPIWIDPCNPEITWWMDVGCNMDPTCGGFSDPVQFYPWEPNEISLAVQDADGKAEIKNVSVPVVIWEDTVTFTIDNSSTAVVSESSDLIASVALSVSSPNSTSFSYVLVIVIADHANEDPLVDTGTVTVYDTYPASGTCTKTGWFGFGPPIEGTIPEPPPDPPPLIDVDPDVAVAPVSPLLFLPGGAGVAVLVVVGLVYVNRRGDRKTPEQHTTKERRSRGKRSVTTYARNRIRELAGGRERKKTLRKTDKTLGGRSKKKDLRKKDRELGE